MAKKKTPNSFDLAAFDGMQKVQDEGIPVDILHPATGEPTGVTIIVAGPDSEAARKAERAVINKQLRGRKMKVQSARDLQDTAREKLAASVISWTGMVADGMPVDCNLENVLTVFIRAPWIADQVADQAGDRAAFFTT